METRNPEKFLLESVDVAKHIADTTPDIIFIMNIHSKALIYANRLFTEVLNYTNEQTMHMHSTIYDIMHPDDIPRMLAHVEDMRSAKDGELRTIEYRLIDANGEIRWFIDRNAVFRRDMNNNVPIEKIGISHEITDDRLQKLEILALNATLEGKNKELESLNSDLTHFFDIAGRDLREPLRKAYSFLEMILNKEAPNLTNAGRSYFRRVQGAIQRLNLITDDIVAFSQVNSNLGAAHLVRLSEVFQQVLATLEKTITDSKATINCDELPLVEGHKHLLYLLFYHLIENGIKFSNLEFPPEIRVKCNVVSGKELIAFNLLDKLYVKIDFSNQGVGFDKTDSERIFKLFEKGDQGIKKKGLGIGLAICKKIIDIHAGYIYATSDDKNSTFTCLLPVAR